LEWVALPDARRTSVRRSLALAITLAVLTLSACGSDDDWSEPRATPSGVGALDAGFVQSIEPPVPESTITPRPGSWDDLHAPEGYRVVLLTYGDDAQTQVLVDAIRDWADETQVSLKTIEPTGPSDLVDATARAMALHPDLIVTAGNDLVDPLAMITPNHLDQKFLVVGAELAEPTFNVTAADWTGASFRGEGLGMSSTYDPATFTPERAGRAVRAGVAAVLADVTGIVVWVE
jgi:hypothetical protein